MTRSAQIGLVGLLLLTMVATLWMASSPAALTQKNTQPVLLAQRYPLTNRSADFYARSKTSNVKSGNSYSRVKR